MKTYMQKGGFMFEIIGKYKDRNWEVLDMACDIEIAQFLLQNYAQAFKQWKFKIREV